MVPIQFETVGNCSFHEAYGKIEGESKRGQLSIDGNPHDIANSVSPTQNSLSKMYFEVKLDSYIKDRIHFPEEVDLKKCEGFVCIQSLPASTENREVIGEMKLSKAYIGTGVDSYWIHASIPEVQYMRIYSSVIAGRIPGGFSISLAGPYDDKTRCLVWDFPKVLSLPISSIQMNATARFVDKGNNQVIPSDTLPATQAQVAKLITMFESTGEAVVELFNQLYSLLKLAFWVWVLLGIGEWVWKHLLSK